MIMPINYNAEEDDSANGKQLPVVVFLVKSFRDLFDRITLCKPSTNKWINNLNVKATDTRCPLGTQSGCRFVKLTSFIMYLFIFVMLYYVVCKIVVRLFVCLSIALILSIYHTCLRAFHLDQLEVLWFFGAFFYFCILLSLFL